jgi:hypothetical protein
VALAADKQSATVDLTARARVGGEPDSYVQEMKFVLKKTDGHWLIVRVETVKTLSRWQVPLLGRVRGGLAEMVHDSTSFLFSA